MENASALSAPPRFARFSPEELKKRARAALKRTNEELTDLLLKAGEGMTLDRYLRNIFVPLVSFGLLTAAILKFIVFRYLALEGVITYAPVLLPLLCLLIAVLYPFMYIGMRGKDIDTKIHLFITYLATISMTGLERKMLFRLASEKEEYGVVAQEMKKILKIADSWNMGFVKACRTVAKTTPSIIFKDFLERLAHAFQAGEDISEFLRLEVDVVMTDYERMYRQALYKIEAANSMYLNLIITLAFVSAFALIFPMLTGLDMVDMVYMTIFLYLAADVAMFLFIKSATPTDDLFHSLPIKTKGQMKTESAVMPVAFLSFLIFVVLLVTNKFSLPIAVALSMTPWLAVGMLSGREEALVVRKDDNFPTFIRSVGSSAGVRGGSITPVIASLRLHDYGPLTDNIRALYRRLSMGDVTRSWRYFAGESGSNLVDKFSRIFIEASYSGGDPAFVGELISKNFQRINTLRKFRLQSASTLKGMLYSAMLGIAISIYITVYMVSSLGEVLTKYTAGGGGEFLPAEFKTGELNMSLILFLIWVLIIIHAALSAIIIKVVDGGDMHNALVHFVVLLWIGAFVTQLTPAIFETFVPI